MCTSIRELERDLRIECDRHRGVSSHDADLVGTAGPSNVLEYHIDRLFGNTSPIKANSQQTPCAREDIRTKYHVNWLLYLLAGCAAKRQPLVSVVIPTYNSGKTVIEAVDSILQQDYHRVEVIVVDDGSQDDTTNRLADYRERIHMIRQDNSGCAAARNAGLQLATGDFVHFLDADDLLASDAISAKIAAFKTIADADICMSPYRCVGHNGLIDADEHVKTPLRDFDCPTIDLMNTVIRRFPMSLCTAMAPRWLWLEVGPFDEDLKAGSDLRYDFRLAQHKVKMIGVDRPLTTVRLTAGSLTTQSEMRLRYNGQVYLLNLIDLLSDPQWWPYVGTMLEHYWGDALRASLKDESDSTIELRARLAAAIQYIPKLARSKGLSAIPLLRVIQDWERRRPDMKALFASPQASRRVTFVSNCPIRESDEDLWCAQHLSASLAGANSAALRVIGVRDSWTTRARSVVSKYVGHRPFVSSIRTSA